MTGVYNLGSTPWARGMDREGDIERLSIAFNDALLVGIVDLWDNVLYLDSALFFNLIYNKPDNYPIDNAKDAVCTTPDASTCTPATLRAGADYNRWMFADALYLTPAVQRLFMNDDYIESGYRRFKDRW